MTLSSPRRLQGEIEADSVDAAALMAAAIGMPAPAAGKGGAAWAWSSEPFAGGVFGDYGGQIALKARRVDLLPRLDRARAPRQLALRQGRVRLRRHDRRRRRRTPCRSGVVPLRRGRLEGATRRFHSPASTRPACCRPARGRRSPDRSTLSAEVEGTGLSPVALIGSLQGSGKIALADAQFAGLDPRAFDAVTRAVDQGLAIDAVRISDVVSKALESGRLAVKQAEGTIAVSAGQVRLSNISADSKDAALSLAGNLDLTDGSIDARLVLSGSSQAAGARPDIFMALKGPLAAPTRSIDVSALTGWLTLRAVENQAKKLRESSGARDRTAARAERQRQIENAGGMRRRNEPHVTNGAPPLANSDRGRAKSAPLQRPISLAPALPAPIDIRPLPAPGRSDQPEASVGPQN